MNEGTWMIDQTIGYREIRIKKGESKVCVTPEEGSLSEYPMNIDDRRPDRENYCYLVGKGWMIGWDSPKDC